MNKLFNVFCKSTIVLNLVLLLSVSTMVNAYFVDRIDMFDNNDVEKYHKDIKKMKLWYVDQNGNNVQNVVNTDGSFATIIGINHTPYEIKKFYYRNGKLRKKVKAMKGVEFDQGVEYDDSTKLLNISNYEFDYKFSLKEVIKLMRLKYNINIEDKRVLFELFREKYSEVFEAPIYDVTIVNANIMSITTFTIDGNTGEVLNIIQKTKPYR